MKIEEIAEELLCALSDDYRVRLGNALQTCRDVWRLANDAALLRLTSSDQVTYDYKPSGNAHARLQRGMGVQPAYCLDQLQPRPYGSLGIVFVRLRVAEVHEHTIAHVFRHEPTGASHGLGDALLIRGDDLAQVLRVHAS